MFPRKIKKFTRRLQDEETGIYVSNFYKAKRTNLQRANLEKYLEYMYTQKPDTMLIGEAPGYNGCRLTGIPFTSEYIVSEGVLEGKLFGLANGYKASKKRVKKEQSATAMWSVLEELEVLPLLWNAFPFHPFKKENINSNRKPNGKELEVGKAYLSELIELFGITQIIAVGNVAEQTLHKMKIKHKKVRHPSYGGKADFKEQLFYHLK